MRTFPLLLALAACSGADPEPTEPDDLCEPPGEPTLQIGLGLAGFEAIEDGGSFPLIHGPQGGFHLEIGLFSTNLAAGDLLSGSVIGTIDGTEYAASYPRLDMRCVRDTPEGDGQESYGTKLIYDSTPDFLDGKTTVVTATITDLDGVEVTTEATFVIADTE